MLKFKIYRASLLAGMFAFSSVVYSNPYNNRMDEFIDNLMSKMTLEEKIGQLNLPASGEIITGQAKVVTLLNVFVKVRLEGCLI